HRAARTALAARAELDELELLARRTVGRRSAPAASALGLRRREHVPAERASLRAAMARMTLPVPEKDVPRHLVARHATLRVAAAPSLERCAAARGLRHPAVPDETLAPVAAPAVPTRPTIPTRSTTVRGNALARAVMSERLRGATRGDAALRVLHAT